MAKMLKEMKSEMKMAHTKPGMAAAPGSVAADQRAMVMTIQGTMPATTPKT